MDRDDDHIKRWAAFSFGGWTAELDLPSTPPLLDDAQRCQRARQEADVRRAHDDEMVGRQRDRIVAEIGVVLDEPVVDGAVADEIPPGPSAVAADSETGAVVE